MTKMERKCTLHFLYILMNLAGIFMVSKYELEQLMNFQITDERYDEICNLTYLPLTRIRTNLTFTKHHHLFVLGRAPTEIMPTGQKVSQWWCICDCPDHNIISVRVNNLTSGNTKSCGCQNNQSRLNNLKLATEACKLDLTGQRFGKLVAICPTEKRINNSVGWLCQCDCGKRIVKGAKDLNNNRAFSCGCLHESKGSLKIRHLLDNNNIEYQTEKTFPTCKLPSGQYARFDFYLLKYNVLIEYDGEQHFYNCDKSFFHDNLKERQLKDNIKNLWALKNNVSLYRIPYYDLNKIQIIQDIFQSQYLIS